MKKYLTLKLIAVAIFSVISIATNALKPEKKYVMSPKKYGLTFKEMLVKTSDNLSVKAWFIPAQNLLPIDEIRRLSKNNVKRLYDTKDYKPKPTLIFCNGDSGNMSYNLPLAVEYVIRGFNVALFDWRGFGESDNFQMDRNQLFYNEFLLDYNAVIDTIYKMPEVDKHGLGLWGYSTGAYLTFATAYKNSRINCVVVRGLMTNFNEVTTQLINQHYATKDELKVPEKYPDKVCPINISQFYDKSVFLVVGENDDRTPVIMSQEVYKKLPGEKRLWIVANAGHGGARAPEVTSKNEFVKRTLAFYKDNLNHRIETNPKAETGK